MTTPNDKQTTKNPPLDAAACCASDEIQKLRDARAKFESEPRTAESVAEYFTVAAESLLTFAQAVGPVLAASRGLTIGEFLDQLEPGRDEQPCS